MATALALCGFCGGILGARKRGRWSIFGLVICALDLLACLLAMTRAAWIGVAIGILAALVLIPALRRLVPIGIGVGAIVVAGVLFAAPNLVEDVQTRFDEKGPVYDRLGSNDSAVRLLHDQPLTGIGWRRFFPYGADWVRQSDAYPMTASVVLEVHNVILSRAAELGIPAAAVFVLICILGCLLGRFPQQRGDLGIWASVAVVSMITWIVTSFFGPMATPFPGYLLWLICGVAAGTAATRSRTTADAAEQPEAA